MRNLILSALCVVLASTALQAASVHQNGNIAGISWYMDADEGESDHAIYLGGSVETSHEIEFVTTGFYPYSSDPSEWMAHIVFSGILDNDLPADVYNQSLNIHHGGITLYGSSGVDVYFIPDSDTYRNYAYAYIQIVPADVLYGQFSYDEYVYEDMAHFNASFDFRFSFGPGARGDTLGRAFAEATNTSIPEPSVLCLLSLGALTLRRSCR